ncbi:MAG TPA: SDR family NAD(P)-dependent oxidoreductase [Minicystis sp.]|nr:SDR family NAD(P)-dependent oxidoreductase [Minicystis sp.]
MQDPEQHVVFVTGASAGIGAAVARRFAAEGVRLVLTARRKERLLDLAAELPTATHVAELDVRDRGAVEACVRALPAEFAAVTVLVNNAGAAHGVARVHEADVADWEEMIDTNVKGALYVIRALLPGMVQRDRGHVINVGSVAGTYAYAGGNVYGATKAFLTQLSLMLRADIAGKNVRVTSIEPGMVANTEFSLVRYKGDAARAKATYKGFPPLQPEDVAEAVCWCASLPRHVNVNRLELMSVMQSFAGFSVARS